MVVRSVLLQPPMQHLLVAPDGTANGPRSDSVLPLMTVSIMPSLQQDNLESLTSTESISLAQRPSKSSQSYRSGNSILNNLREDQMSIKLSSRTSLPSIRKHFVTACKKVVRKKDIQIPQFDFAGLPKISGNPDCTYFERLMAVKVAPLNDSQRKAVAMKNFSTTQQLFDSQHESVAKAEKIALPKPILLTRDMIVCLVLVEIVIFFNMRSVKLFSC